MCKLIFFCMYLKYCFVSQCINLHCSCVVNNTFFTRYCITGEAVIEDPIPSCSGLQTPPRRSVFRGIKGLSRVDATPRKQHLMRRVEAKEAHIRNLKKLCKKKANDIKALANIEDSPVVRNLFRGMTSTTADFLISQLRCAR